MMGDTGPCGPCSEIFYDHGPKIPGGPPGSANEDGDRFVEIWNLVFMQYERDIDGNLNQIPKPSVDTGMGLERMAAVLQGVHNNYDIDLFRRLIDSVREIVPDKNPEVTSLRVLADHIRSCAFLIMDGIAPSNEGRGYVLRRIIRRAIRHGNKLGANEPFFHRLVSALENQMGDAIVELGSARARIEKILYQEEERFADTLKQGLVIFESAVAKLEGVIIPGEVAFKLNDTYGFPVDLTGDIARERGLDIDMDGYITAMDAQRERARAASRFENLDTATAIESTALAALDLEQDFCGYEKNEISTVVAGLFVDGEMVTEVKEGETAIIVLASTPFYAESGGQVGDRGTISTENAEFFVGDVQEQARLILHFGKMETGTIYIEDGANAVIAVDRRQATRLNHSATHLLHAALRTVLGTHVMQKGSLVDPERLRFDFSHSAPVSDDQLMHIEQIVNKKICENIVVESDVMPYKHAIDDGAIALFGEKYAEEVRVLRMGSFSVELCGGTHVSRTGDIGLFKLISEGGVSAGVRRIEGLTGMHALDYVQTIGRDLNSIAGLVKAPINETEQRVEGLVERIRVQDKEIRSLKDRIAGQASGDLRDAATMVGEIHVISQVIDGADMATLRSTMDGLKDRLQQAVIVLAAIENDQVRLIAGVTKDLTSRMTAGKLVNYVARQVGGKGGGRPDMAQAGGDDPSKLEAALSSVVAWVEEKAG